jgi:hypothetical protein
MTSSSGGEPRLALAPKPGDSADQFSGSTSPSGCPSVIGWPLKLRSGGAMRAAELHAQQVGRAGQVTGLDVSAQMIARAQERSTGISGIDWLLADAAKHVFASPSYDLCFLASVSCSSVIQWLQLPKARQRRATR